MEIIKSIQDSYSNFMVDHFQILVWVMVILLPGLGLLGKYMRKKYGNKYNQEILPKAQMMINKLTPHMSGSLYAQALNPDQWKTDKKSVWLIIIGLPIGCVLIFALLFLISYWLGN